MDYWEAVSLLSKLRNTGVALTGRRVQHLPSGDILCDSNSPTEKVMIDAISSQIFRWGLATDPNSGSHYLIADHDGKVFWFKEEEQEEANRGIMHSLVFLMSPEMSESGWRLTWYL